MMTGEDKDSIHLSTASLINSSPRDNPLPLYPRYSWLVFSCLVCQPWDAWLRQLRLYHLLLNRIGVLLASLQWTLPWFRINCTFDLCLFWFCFNKFCFSIIAQNSSPCLAWDAKTSEFSLCKVSTSLIECFSIPVAILDFNSIQTNCVKCLGSSG